jgi:hypothetical protein
MPIRRNYFGVFLSILVALSRVNGQSYPLTSPVAAPHVSHQLFEMTNRSRADAGVKPLSWDTALEDAAQRHCARMASEIPVLIGTMANPIWLRGRRQGAATLAWSKRILRWGETRKRFTTHGSIRLDTERISLMDRSIESELP